MTNPQRVAFRSGSFFSGYLKLKFCKIAVKHKNIVFLAKVSPAQSRFPAPNGRLKSFFRHNFPSSSKNLSGLNTSGSFQIRFSLWKAYKDV